MVCLVRLGRVRLVSWCKGVKLDKEKEIEEKNFTKFNRVSAKTGPNVRLCYCNGVVLRYGYGNGVVLLYVMLCYAMLGERWLFCSVFVLFWLFIFGVVLGRNFIHSFGYFLSDVLYKLFVICHFRSFKFV